MNNSESLNTPNAMHSLKDISLRKAQLLTDITKDANKMQDLWMKLTQKPAGTETPSRKLASAMLNGANVVDGIILGWKLYSRFWGGAPSKTNKKNLFGFLKRK